MRFNIRCTDGLLLDDDRIARLYRDNGIATFQTKVIEPTDLHCISILITVIDLRISIVLWLIVFF